MESYLGRACTCLVAPGGIWLQREVVGEEGLRGGDARLEGRLRPLGPHRGEHPLHYLRYEGKGGAASKARGAAPQRRPAGGWRRSLLGRCRRAGEAVGLAAPQGARLGGAGQQRQQRQQRLRRPAARSAASSLLPRAADPPGRSVNLPPGAQAPTMRKKQSAAEPPRGGGAGRQEAPETLRTN